MTDDDTGMTDEELTDRQVADTMNGLLRGAWRGQETPPAKAGQEPTTDGKTTDPGDMNVLLRAARWGVDAATAAERMRTTGDDAA